GRIREEPEHRGGRNPDRSAEDRQGGGGQGRDAPRLARGGQTAQVEPEHVPPGIGGDSRAHRDREERFTTAPGKVRPRLNGSRDTVPATSSRSSREDRWRSEGRSAGGRAPD